MSDLYDSALVTLPSGEKVTISKLIGVVTLENLTPSKLQWVDLMVKAQMEGDGATGALTIKPGFTDYVLRQIIYYGIDAMMGDTPAP